MTIKHHLPDNLLMAYSAGQLPEAFSLVVATHLSMCDDCRAQAESFDMIGGALLEDEPMVSMAPASLQHAMARIAGLPPIARKARSQGILPTPLQDYVGGDLANVKWRSIGAGVRQAILPTMKGATVRLLYIPAGQAVPDHGHRGIELTLVLQGAFHDATDRFARGDVEVASEDLKHTPIAEEWSDCICLAATDAPLRFTGLLPRIVQPFFRI
jgi:putative transcriptional regulator